MEGGLSAQHCALLVQSNELWLIVFLPLKNSHTHVPLTVSTRNHTYFPEQYFFFFFPLKHEHLIKSEVVPGLKTKVCDFHKTSMTKSFTKSE